MIWDRDYMKKPPQTEEDDQTESPSTPFNLFAGLKPEPLPSPTARLPTAEPSSVQPIQSAKPSQPTATEVTEKPSRTALIVAVALVAIVIILLAMYL